MAKYEGNFEQIKQQMKQQKKLAETVKREKEPVVEKEEQQVGDSFTILLVQPQAQAEKKTVNFYLSKELIGRIEKGAKRYNKKKSVFVEELLEQVLDKLDL